MFVFVYDIQYVDERLFPICETERVLQVADEQWNEETCIDIVSEKIGYRVIDFKYKLLD